MTTLKKVLLVGTLVMAIATPVIGQVHKYFTPGSAWTVSMIRIAPGMDPMYLEYLDSRFKKGEDAQVKAGSRSRTRSSEPSTTAGSGTF